MGIEKATGGESEVGKKMSPHLRRDLAAIVAGAIESNHAKRGSAPVLRGTRFPVAQVIAELADGRTVHDVANDYDLNEELVIQAVREVARSLEEKK